MKEAKDASDSWLKFLNPDTLRTNMILSGCFLAGYELLKESIIDQLRSFYTNGFDENDPIISRAYESEVLSLDPKKNVFRASVEWLRKNGVIDQGDCDAIEKIKLHRNELAHDLPEFLATAGREIQIHLFQSLRELVQKVDWWWIENVDLAIDAKWQSKTIDRKDITSGTMMFLDLLLGIATGAHSTELYEQFLEAQKSLNRTK